MSKAWIFRLALALLIGVAAVFAITYREHLSPEAVQAWVQQIGLLAPLVFILLFALSAVLMLPATLMVISGAVLFGPYWGTFYNVTGATLGAAVAFLIARYIASDWVERKAGKRLKKLVHGVEREGWRFVAFTRLVPILPYFILNYALGLTRIKFSHYTLTTYITLIPSVTAFTYLAWAGQGALTGGEGFIKNIIIGIAAVGLIAFIPVFLRMRRAKRESQALD